MTMLGILLTSSAITTLPHRPVRIEFMDKPQPKTTQMQRIGRIQSWVNY